MIYNNMNTIDTGQYLVSVYPLKRTTIALRLREKKMKKMKVDISNCHEYILSMGEMNHEVLTHQMHIKYHKIRSGILTVRLMQCICRMTEMKYSKKKIKRLSH